MPVPTISGDKIKSRLGPGAGGLCRARKRPLNEVWKDAWRGRFSLRRCRRKNGAPCLGHGGAAPELCQTPTQYKYQDRLAHPSPDGGFNIGTRREGESERNPRHASGAAMMFLGVPAPTCSQPSSSDAKANFGQA